MSAAHMHASAWAFGDKDVWPGDGPEPSAAERERLAKEKIAGFYRTDEAPWRIAARSAAETLRRAARRPDLVLYACESIDDRVDLRRDPDRFAEAIGADHVPLMLVTANVCANFGALLRVARNHVLTGDARDVLVVTTDVWGGGSRLIDAGTCLMSDAAASVMVSADAPAEGWRVGPVVQAADHTMHSLDPAEDSIAMVRGTVGGIQRATEGFFAPGPGGDREDYPIVVAGNVGTTVLRLLAAGGRLDLDRFVTRTEQNGHCFAADLVVNLAEVEDEVPAGGRVLGLSTGHNYWTCVAFERV
ncbi:beta-ketoacyl-[acyl-carrier-protein] synthase family protein [Actinocorallia populi]|uniref:hypothetical protein n=1 Tax=Actinocorallia populi TaxID=2079200 RepID=UPI000D0881EB|nr:hypothetical protein [Actinocorallia populi]